MAKAAPDEELPRGIARFWSADGRVTGAGFLIAERTLCTCAHVVATALGSDESASTPPTAPVPVDFPLLNPPTARRTATVTHWSPVRSDGGGDIALLTLTEPVPGTTPVRFAGGTGVWGHPFRVLGFPLRTDDHGVWVRGRLRAPVGKGWTSMEAAPASPAVGRGFSGSPVWDLVQGGVVGMTVAAEVGTGATTAYLIPAALLLGLEPGLQGSPFRGLEPFREQDAAVFHGRRADSERIARAVRGTSFVPVVGASGVGKSSVARAGVLPLLRAAGYTITDFTRRPGADPVRGLLLVLQQQFPRVTVLQGLATELSSHPPGAPQRAEIALLIGGFLLEHAGAAGHVVLLDQFEETIGSRPTEARELLTVLLAMGRARGPGGRGLRVLATLRSASLEELVAGGEAEQLSLTIQMVAPMTSRQLRDIVCRPIEDTPGVEFEPGLADLIVSGAGREPGALPLVEFVLAELWERKERGRLTHSAYRRIGGVEGALAQYADQKLNEVCQSEGGPPEAEVRRLFEQLTRPDEDQGYLRLPRAYAQLSDGLKRAAQALADTRLLVIGRDSTGRETVALAHESLVRQWPTLRGWLDESREFRQWQERLRSRMHDWKANDHHPDLLLRGQELTEAWQKTAAHAAELSAAEHDFVRQSRRHRSRTRLRSRVVVAMVCTLTLLVSALGVVAWQLMRTGDQGEQEATAQKLVEYAEERSRTDPVGGAVLALAALRTRSTTETRAAVLRQTAPLADALGVYRLFPEGEVRAAAASADGRRMAVLHHRAGDPGTRTTVRVVSGLGDGEPRATALSGSPDQADAVAVSDDGTYAAAGAPDGHVRVWALEKRRDRVRVTGTWAWRWRPPPAAARTDSLDFSGGGARTLLHLVTEGDDSCEAGEQYGLFLGRTRTGSRRALPHALVGRGECVVNAVLPEGTREAVTVQTTEDAPSTASSYEWTNVRTADLAPGPPAHAWSQEAVGSAVLSPGGRAFGVIPPGQERWVLHADLDRSSSAGADWPFDTDVREAGGRYFGDSTYNLSGEGAYMAVYMLRDGESGRTYSTMVPRAVIRGLHATVVAVPGSAATAPIVYAVLGSDLLAFRTRPTPYPLKEVTSNTTYEAGRSAAGDVLAVVHYESSYHEDGGMVHPVRPLSVLVSGKRVRSTRIRVDDENHAVVSGDGRSLVVWSSGRWRMWGTGLSGRWPDVRGEGKAGGLRGQRGIVSVDSWDSDAFLLLDGGGLRRLDGVTGQTRRVRGPDCAWESAVDPGACVFALGRPGYRGQFLVARADGAVEIWSEDVGTPLFRTRLKSMPDVDHAYGAQAAFRQDGMEVALKTRDGVVLWIPGASHQHREIHSAVERLGPFSRQGLLVLETGEDGGWDVAELWDVGRGESVGRLLPPDDAFVVSLTGRTLAAVTPKGELQLSLAPLRGDDKGVCGVLRRYPLSDPERYLPDRARERALIKAPCQGR